MILYIFFIDDSYLEKADLTWLSERSNELSTVLYLWQTLVILNDTFSMPGTVLGGSKPMRFHGPIMDTIIPKIGSNLTFESL